MKDFISKDEYYCKFCGSEVKRDAQFCKKCGKSFKGENGLIFRINSKINIFPVLLGLIVSVFVLLIGAGFFGMIISNSMDSSLYMFLVLFFMLFFGGLVTGITGARTVNEGLINGGVLSLVIFLLLGFMLGIVLFISIGILTSIANAFSSFGTSPATSATTATSINPSQLADSLFIIIKYVLALVISFLAGIGGGGLGALIKGVSK